MAAILKQKMASFKMKKFSLKNTHLSKFDKSHFKKFEGKNLVGCVPKHKNIKGSIKANEIV
jgi:hypothetical protein